LLGLRKRPRRVNGVNALEARTLVVQGHKGCEETNTVASDVDYKTLRV
jgi:hypothetical protein